MKVLYCNPVFFEYRLPFYKELKRLFKGKFYVMYSPMRMRICGKEKFSDRVKEELGENALPLLSDHVFDTYSKGFDRMPDIERGKRIPFTFGLMRAIRKVRPDVLITEGYFQWTPLVLLYGLLFRVPVYMGYERTCWTERDVGRFKTWQRKLFNKKITGFLVNGQETKRYLESINVPSSRIYIGGMSADSRGITDGIRKKTKKEIDLFRAKFQQDKGLMYLFSGRISVLKGVVFLLNAWEKHIKTHHEDQLVLIGNGDKYEEMKAKYAHESSVHFEGAIRYDDICKYYAISDVFILPTLTDNWSLVVPEAMACGLPVATSIYNGCYPELVHKDENGITFDPYKEETLVAALDYFHHQDLKAMGRKSMELEKEFNTEHCARRVYDALTGIGR